MNAATLVKKLWKYRKECATSDVNVLVVGSASFAAVVEALSRAGERLRRDVDPVAMTKAAFGAKLASRDRRMAREQKIFLLGDAGSLQNLPKIEQLKEHPPDAAEVRRRLVVFGGVRARIGALGACKELFRPWRMTTGEGAGG